MPKPATYRRQVTPVSPAAKRLAVGETNSELAKVRQVNVVDKWLRVAKKKPRVSLAPESRPENHLESITDEVLRKVTGQPSTSFDDSMATFAAQLLGTFTAWAKLIIIPTARWKHIWDLFVIVLVIYNAIMLPLIVAFPDAHEGTERAVFEGLIDVIFLVDMILHARTATPLPDGSLEVQGKAILRTYLRGWFAIDLLATIPFDHLLGGLLGEDKLAITVIGTLKCFRLLRLGRVLRYIENMRYANMWRVGRLVAFYVLFLHWCSCLWYFVGIVQESHEAWTNKAMTDGDTTWQLYWLSSARIAQIVGGANLSDADTSVERLVATVLFIVGAVFNATLFGQVALLLSNRNSVHQAYQDKMDAVNQNLRLLGLPEDLQRRVRHFYEYSFHQHRMLDYKEFVGGLSPALGGEVSLYIHRDMVERVPVFQGCSPDFMVDLVGVLTHRMYLPDDLIVRYGETGDEMFFINTGTCQVLSKDRRTIIARLFRRDYFGELSLMTDAPRTATVQAETYCDISCLKRSNLDVLCAAYPATARLIQAEASRRIKEWRRTLKNASSMHDVARVRLLADAVASEFLSRVRARIAARRNLPEKATRQRSSAGDASTRAVGAGATGGLRARRSPSPQKPGSPAAGYSPASRYSPGGKMSPLPPSSAETTQLDRMLVSLDTSRSSLPDFELAEAEVPQLGMPPRPSNGGVNATALAPLKEEGEEGEGVDTPENAESEKADFAEEVEWYSGEQRRQAQEETSAGMGELKELLLGHMASFEVHMAEMKRRLEKLEEGGE